MSAVPSIGTLCVVLKDNLIGEVMLSCSTVTDVAITSSGALSNASVIYCIILQRYVPTSVFRTHHVKKVPIIGRPRFNGGMGHPSSGTPSSYTQTSPEIAEAKLSRGPLKRPGPTCPSDRTPMVIVVWSILSSWWGGKWEWSVKSR